MQKDRRVRDFCIPSLGMHKPKLGRCKPRCSLYKQSLGLKFSPRRGDFLKRVPRPFRPPAGIYRLRGRGYARCRHADSLATAAKMPADGPQKIRWPHRGRRRARPPVAERRSVAARYFSFSASCKRNISSRYWAASMKSNFLAASCIRRLLRSMLFSNCSRVMYSTIGSATAVVGSGSM